MDSVVVRRPGPALGLRRRLSRRHVLLGLIALLAIGLALIAAIREFAPRLVDTSPPPQDVCGIPGVTVAGGQTTPTTWDNSHTWVIESSCAGGVTVPFGTTLTLDGGHGPVTVLTHGPGLTVSGGALVSAHTSSTNTVSFDTEFDAPTWPGIYVTTDAANPPHRGTANLAFVTVGGHLNLSGKPDYGIRIDSGATSLPGGFGLILSNVNVFNASNDGVHAVDTAIQVSGPGTISDAGSAGISATFTSGVASSGVSVSGMTVARSGNEGILADLASAQPASITGNSISTAGLYGIHLINAASPTLTGNSVYCSGHQDSVNCPGARTRYPAIFLDGGSFDFGTISSNNGSQNGMDAIAMHGTVTSNLTWVNPTDSSSTNPLTNHLGYLVAGGDGLLTIQRKTLTVPAGGVVKVAGALAINNGRLDASAGNAIFTSLDDNGPAGVTQACPSAFFSTCPNPPLGGSEWSGITLHGDATGPATALFDNATVAHGSTAISISNNGWNFGISTFGLTVRNGSTVQSASSDGIVAVDTPVLVDHSTVSGVGAHGISASFLGPAPASAGLSVTSSTVQSSGNEGILGTALSGQPVTITNDSVKQAGAYGIRLEGAGLGSGGSLSLKSNTLTGNGSGSTPYPAIYLNGVSADFTTGVAANAGNGNGLDAIVFHGTALGNLTWQTAGINATSSTPLGYLLDAGLQMNGGSLTLHPGDVVKAARGGQITINGPYSVDGSDSSSNRSKVFTSLKDTTQGIPICPATVLADCSAPSPGDWGGLNLTGGAGATIANGLLRYASTAIAVDHGAPVNLTDTSIDSTSSDGITAVSTVVSVTGTAPGRSTFSSIGQHGINAAMSGVTAGGNQLFVSGVRFTGSGNEAILGTSLGGHPTAVSGNTIDGAGFSGINLQGADQLTLQGNVVRRSGFGAGGPYPAIYLNGVTGDFTTAISGNTGALNALNALAFHGSVTTNLSWKDPTPSAVLQDLGYLLDGDLTLGSGQSLTVHAGDRVKVENGAIHLNGGTLYADGTRDGSGNYSPAPKIFTSLSDNSTGITACPSSLLAPCPPQPRAGEWGGLILTEDSSHDRASASLFNAVIRYATTGLSISSGASTAPGSSAYGLVLDHSRISRTSGDGITSQDTPLALTADSIGSAGGHGVSADLLGAPAGSGILVRNVDVVNTTSDGLSASSLTGHPVWIADSRVRNAGAYGIQLKNADELVLRNNFVCGSGAAAAGAGCVAGASYPAVYLNGVTADFVNDVRGNRGQNNGLDAIVLHGTVTSNLNWIDPVNTSAPHPLGYLLDSSLVMNGNLTLTVHQATVKAFGGGITLNGGTLDASGATFTSLADSTAGINLCPGPSSTSPFIVCGQAPRADNWGGITVSNDENGHAGSATLVDSHVKYALTGIAIDNGAPAGLVLEGTEVGPANGDGINAQDTAVTVTDSLAGHSSIHNVGARGINASFTGTTAAGGVTVSNASFNQSGKEAILANVISGQAISITGSSISNAGTYGIQLIGASSPVVKNDNLVTTGFTGTSAGTHFPAIYLNGLSGADFGASISGNTGYGNSLDAIAFHGSTSTGLTWQTAAVNPVPPPMTPANGLGYLLDGALTIGGDFTVPDGAVVRSAGGAITVNGNLLAGGSGNKTFTSLREAIVPVACPSPLIKLAGCTPKAGDWGGLTVNGYASLANATISYDDGLTVNAGAARTPGGFGLEFAGKVAGAPKSAMHDILGNAIVVTGSPVSVTNVSFSQVGGDGIDSSNSGGKDVITDDDFDHVAGIAVNLNNSPSDHIDRNTYTNGGGNAVKTAGGAVTVTCGSFQSGGLSGDASLKVNQSDFAPGVGVSAPAGANVDDNWWGQTSGPSGQLSGGVALSAASAFLSSQKPTATIDVSGLPSTTQTLDNVNANGAIGTGLVHAVLTFSRDMNPETSEPNVSYASTPVSFSGAWDPGAHPKIWRGDAPADSSLAPPGTHSVSAGGAHSCVPDPQLTLNNVMVPAGPKAFTADTTGLPTVTVGAADLVGSGSARMHGHVVPNGWATGAVHSGQFVLTNTAWPFDSHSYDTPPLLDKTTPLDFTLVADHLNSSATYSIHLNVLSVNGTATESTSDSVTTTAPASKAVFTVDPPSSIHAGDFFSAAVSAEDPSGTVVADFSGSVSISLTAPAGATLSGTASQSVVNGVASFSGLSVDKTGSYTLTPAATPPLSPAASSSFSITPAAVDHFVVTTIGSQTAGHAFSVQATAYDAMNNVKTDYSGGATVGGSVAAPPGSAPSGCGGTCPPSYGSFGTWSSGVASASVTLYLAEQNRSLTVADGTHTGTSNLFDVVAADASSLQVSGYPSATDAGVAHDFSVTALDAYGNTARAYGGTVTFGSSDALVDKPSNSTLTLGTGTFSATFNTGGTQSLSATDSVSSGITGTQSGIAVTPAPPGSFSAGAHGTGEIDLSWTASPGATGYDVLRSAASGGPYSEVGGTPTTTGVSYADTGLDPATTYYYVVRAEGSAGTSGNSLEASATTVPAAPTGLSASATANTVQVDLSWTGSTGATSYDVKRGSSSGGPYSDDVGTTSSSSLSDTTVAANTTYYYVVYAIDSGGTSGASNEASVTTVPAAPTAPAASVISSTEIDLSWTGSTGATSYDVLRGAASGGPYSPIVNTTNTTFDDTGLVAGHTYYYVVQARSAAGPSPSSSEVSGSTVPAPPATVGATANGTTEIDLSWTASTGATSYNVKRGTAHGGPYSSVGTPTSAGFNDTGLTAGSTYYYVVEAVDSGGTSADSGEASATTVPAAPTALSASATANKVQVDLTWTGSTGATSYDVKRGTTTTGPYTDDVGTTASTSLSDTTVAANTTYYYVVYAIDSGGTSAASNEASVTTVPAAPTSVTATAVSSTEIDLSWSGSAGATGYDVLRGTTMGGPYALVGTSPSTTGTTFNDTGLAAGTTYYYVVQARSAAGPSPNSSEASATTLP